MTHKYSNSVLKSSKAVSTHSICKYEIYICQYSTKILTHLVAMQRKAYLHYVRMTESINAPIQTPALVPSCCIFPAHWSPWLGQIQMSNVKFTAQMWPITSFFFFFNWHLNFYLTICIVVFVINTTASIIFWSSSSLSLPPIIVCSSPLHRIRLWEVDFLCRGHLCAHSTSLACNSHWG